MKFIGFLGKKKEAGDPVLEYHPPGEEQVQEPVREEYIHRRSASWGEVPMEDLDSELPEEEEELEEEYAQAQAPSKPPRKKSGKRQLVLAALVMALGAAVYLNWQFSGNQQLLAADTLSSEKELGTAQLVNGEAESGTESEEEAAAQSTAETGEAQFTQARLSRQQARDEAVELLEGIIKDAESSDEAKKEAVAQSAEIAQNVLRENNIENLVKAKGYSDCVAVIQNGECSVIVSGKLQNESDAVVIQDIVAGQTDFSPEKIKIVESEASK